ncbi:AAA family ATPase [Spirosoma rigui]|uniref:AAA family ATPase n=1 Tax=Spirosoma rigui TaxID=564064 RepID=UPI0014736452|nr:AAA family ATPase [Spirosoma rigui]
MLDDLKQHVDDIANQLNQLPEPVISTSNAVDIKPVQSDERIDPPDYAAMSERLRVRPDEDIPPPPVCLSVLSSGHSSTFGTIGNFSVIIGKAKSRKTFTTTIALAAASKRDVILNRFAGSFDNDKQTVLYFDTEQGRYHVLKVVKRICRLAGQENPDHLLVYSLRSLPTAQRLGFIQWHIYNTPNLGLVVIDGIRDTVEDINDNAEATERVGDLLRWTEQRGIHILTVIHMNKGNDQIRGTIGTELQNKAETVVSVTVDPANKDISIVKAEYCRDKEFEPFAFSIDDQGLPYIVEDWDQDQRPSKRKPHGVIEKPRKPSITDQFSKTQHRLMVRRMFDSVQPEKYASTWQRLKRATSYFGESVSDNAAKELLNYYQDEGLVIKSLKGLYSMSQLATEPVEGDTMESSSHFTDNVSESLFSEVV